MNYDEKLKAIDLFKVHPTLLPFVGDEYDKYRILHIGESHYINQKYDSEKYGIEYFVKWWKNPCNEILDDSPGYVDTRYVLSNYMNGINGSYSIFINFTKSFSRVVLNKEISKIFHEDKALYKYVAFMNYFQMPSLYKGENFWNSLKKSAQKCGKKELASKTWYTAVEHSTAVVDSVIEILNPKAIVFASISAGEAYKDSNGKFASDSRLIITSHPGSPYSWNKPISSLGYQKGVDFFEKELKRIYNG